MTKNQPRAIVLGMREKIEKLASQAGEFIWDRYEDGENSIHIKEDETPVTEADLGANEIILKGLRAISDFPVVSEESIPPWEDRKKWNTYWLVDPLDGTKGFINRTGDFTVNIALIQNGHPILGVISLPKSGDVYSAEFGKGAFKNGSAIFNERQGKMTVGMASKLHEGGEGDFLKSLGVEETIYVNSSLKLCWLAEGKADIYPRIRPTMQWDTGAGEIILKEAGCEIVNWETMDSLPHGTESLINPQFIAYRKSAAQMIAKR